ncbi:aminopeptidase P family protein [candidate division KSB1 bacterium]|nr:aminopeptidase P family protein [candidate division KSB1 bacterium]
MPDPVLDLILGTHCTWQSALILTRKGRKIAIVGSLDAQNVKDHAGYEIRSYVNSIKPELLGVLEEENPAKIAVNQSVNDVMADGLTHGMFQILLEHLEGTPFTDRLISSESIVAALRGRKSPEEIERIKDAITETLDIYDQVTHFVKAGMTEKDVADFINKLMDGKGLEPGWDPTHCPAVFTGPDSAGAHAGPTGRQIEPGHIMNIDFGVKKADYVSDLQRTWYFMREGENGAPEPVQRGFDTIHTAIRKAAKALKPGVQGWEVDAVARSYIVEAGYEEYPHGLGHQVGRKAHDGAALLGPKWDRYKEQPMMTIEKGQVFTLEPRLTVEGHGIATIEEIVEVTEEGCQFLSEPQEQLYLINS